MTDQTGTAMISKNNFCNLPCKKEIVVTIQKNFVCKNDENVKLGRILYLTQNDISVNKNGFLIGKEGKYNVYVLINALSKKSGTLNLKIKNMNFEKIVPITANKTCSFEVNLNFFAKTNELLQFKLFCSQPDLTIKEFLVIIENVCSLDCPKLNDIKKNVKAIEK